MSRIDRIRISGFRRLNDVELEMRPLMVMIGANGVGKTSVLDALSLLSASARGTLNTSLNRLGGVSNILSSDGSPNIILGMNMSVPGYESLKYELEIEPKGPSYSISREELSQPKEGYADPFKHIDSHYDVIRYFEVENRQLVKPQWEYYPLETSLSQVPKMFRHPEELRRMLASVTQYHVLDVSERAPVKLPQQMKPADLPGEDGEDLVPFLYYLRESDPDRFEAIEDALKSGFHGFESLSFPPVAAGMITMTWKEKQFSKPLYMDQLSEGTLRFIWLTSLLQSPGLATITMIDEPEVSLHPELLNLLAELMREASEKTQIIIGTHSDSLIRFLDPSEVVVMDVSDEGYAIARWADSLDLEKWLKDYELDELWRMGRIGARS